MGIANLGTVKNFAIRPTVGGVGVLLVGEAGQSDIPQTRMAPATSQTITAGYSAVVAGRYTIAVATRLTIGLEARFGVI